MRVGANTSLASLNKIRRYYLKAVSLLVFLCVCCVVVLHGGPAGQAKNT